MPFNLINYYGLLIVEKNKYFQNCLIVVCELSVKENSSIDTYSLFWHRLMGNIFLDCNH